MAVVATFIGDFWRDQIVAHGRQDIFLLLVAFLLSFGFIRTSARLSRSVSWWPGSVVTDSGVHLHHLVWGISLMMISGALGYTFGGSPWEELTAIGFGIGIGLTLDEFALWVYLKDVYWAEQGRKSLDAVALATALMLVMLLGGRPFDLTDTSAAGVAVGVALTLVTVVICFLKEKLIVGAVGIFVPIVALVGAMRIGKPGSPWARWRYGERNPRRQAKAERRFGPDSRYQRWLEAARDAFGGRTTAERRQHDTREHEALVGATAEIRHRAEQRSAPQAAPPAD